MSDFLEYSFRIIGPKPETIPMSRLASYMSELARLMGSSEGVHFQRIEDKSVSIIAIASQDDIALISPRIRGASRGEVSADVSSSWKRINEYLAEDGWAAEMRLPRSSEVIVFPGKAKTAASLRSVNQPTSVQGRLIRIEGAGDIVRVGLEIDGDLTARLSLDAHHAQQLAAFFHRYVRLTGEGRWKRDSSGKWSLESLSASSFEILEEGDIKAVLHDLSETIPPGAGREILATIDELRRA